MVRERRREVFNDHYAILAAAYFVIGANIDSINDERGHPERLKKAV